jgi:hypothetical protein
MQGAPANSDLQLDQFRKADLPRIQLAKGFALDIPSPRGTVEGVQ